MNSVSSDPVLGWPSCGLSLVTGCTAPSRTTTVNIRRSNSVDTLIISAIKSKSSVFYFGCDDLAIFGQPSRWLAGWIRVCLREFASDDLLEEKRTDVKPGNPTCD